ncbi:MAG: tetratricopeptide repeat protein [Nitrospirae bacterium]|nr:tetratricopeptide repeat protein [Nitrospirota bacterium]
MSKAPGEKDSSGNTGILHKPAAHILLIVILGLLAYSNTFNVPFQWDDKALIADNPLVKDLGYFLEPSKAKDYSEYSLFLRRYISFLTFALNYKIHGLDVMGYHVVNITIHILSALLVYILVILTFRTPYFSSQNSEVGIQNGTIRDPGFIALFASLLFVSHPIQTEAVTYIMQRFASLAAMWYLLSIVFYIKARLHHGLQAEGKVFSFSTLMFYLLSLLSALLAMMTKENSLTLPFAITLYEFIFFKGILKRRIFFLIPLFLPLLVFPFTLSETGIPIGKLLFGIDSETGRVVSRSVFDKDYLQATERWDYFITQPRVVVTYLRLLLLPIHQNIDYDYPLYHSFSDPHVYLPFLFLLSILCFGGYLLYRSRVTRHGSRLAAFGIFWFFLTLSVESSIIPIPMVIAEYRMYLPSVGLFIAFSTALFHYGERLNIAKRLFTDMRYSSLFLLAGIVIALLSTTYARNAVWQSEISLWKDVVKKSPEKVRGHNELGLAYNSKGLTDKAIEQFQVALRLDPYLEKGYINLGISYTNKQWFDKAIDSFQTALRLKSDNADTHYNLGIAYYHKGSLDDAIEHFEVALKLKPDNADFQNNLGIACKAKGLFENGKP